MGQAILLFPLVVSQNTSVASIIAPARLSCSHVSYNMSICSRPNNLAPCCSIFQGILAPACGGLVGEILLWWRAAVASETTSGLKRQTKTAGAPEDLFEGLDRILSGPAGGLRCTSAQKMQH